MSTSIRPPTGSPPGISGVDAPTQVDRAAEASPTSATSSVEAGQAKPTSAAQSPTQVWLARLEAGEVTRGQAIEGLVAQALEAHGGARLTPAQRTELEGILRSALLDDPVLGRLLGGA